MTRITRRRSPLSPLFKGRLEDPQPHVIDLLMRASIMDNHRLTSEKERAALKAEIDTILDAWFLREDEDELRQLLELNTPRGRRRTRQQVDREIEIAAFCEKQAKVGARDPINAAMAKFACSQRTVERAVANWRDRPPRKR